MGELDEYVGNGVWRCKICGFEGDAFQVAMHIQAKHEQEWLDQFQDADELYLKAKRVFGYKGTKEQFFCEG